MKKLLILLVVIFLHPISYGDDIIREIAELHIDAKGNNKYEAKIKAHEQGMQRALYIIADKINIENSSIAKIPYSKLKQVFIISTIAGEIQTEESYSATVSYKYDLYAINQLLYEYGDDSVHDKFYEYILIPVFKQKKMMNIWDENTEWNSKWAKVRTILDYYKLYYPKSSPLLRQTITLKNIFYLNYRDFLDIFQNILAKKVIIMVCEFFTDPSNGKAVMQIKTTVLEYKDLRHISEEVYPLNSLDEISRNVNNVILTTINRYGQLRATAPKNIDLDLNNDHPKIITKEIIETPQDNTKSIMLNIDAYDDDELEIIKKKLQNVKVIKNFSIKHDIGRKYKVTIWTEASEYQLAEEFYFNGLSFRIYGNLYNLIDIKKGG